MKRLKEILKQSLVLILVGQMCTMTLPLYSADITVDTSVPVNQRPTLDMSRNGVTIVNLSTTTAGGVSVNRFTEYNVGPNGIILNNSATMGVSILGGAIYGNPNYQATGREATIVVNEVTGAKRSDILGYTEMFGKSAEFIFVNPNGIMLNGAGFINMPRVTLGTGRAIYDSDGFSGISLNGGTVSIEGKGVNAEKVDYFTVLTRMASLKGAIWGKDVNITTGTGTYNYRDKTFNQVDAGSLAPELAIDASTLGSIYAGRIAIISNEKGVGVKSDAGMLADVSDITITADGGIELKNTQAAGDINVFSASGRLVQRGDAFAMGNISYSGIGFTNRGDVKAAKNLTINGYIDNQNGVLAANDNIELHTGGTLLNDGGSITLAGDTGRIWMHGNDSFTLQGGNVKSAGGIDIDMTGNVSFAPGTLSVYADKYFTLGGLSFNNGINLSMNGSIDVNVSGNIVNGSGSSIISDNGVTLASSGQIFNSGEISGSFVNITGASLDNNTSSSITGGSGISAVNISGDITNSGRISGASDLSVTAGNITNTDAMSEISSGGKLTVDTVKLQNNGGFLFSAEDMYLKTKTLNNIRGYIYSMGDMDIIGKGTSGNSIYNYSGNIESEGSMTISIGSDGKLTNTGEDSGSYTKELITVGGRGYEHWALMQQYELTSTMYTQSSFLVSGGDMDITAGDVFNYGSVISSGNNLTINADTVVNLTNSEDIYLAQYQYWGIREKHKIRIGSKRLGFKWKEWHDNHEKWTSGIITVPSNSVAIIQGAGDVTINARSVFNGIKKDFDASKVYSDKNEIETAVYKPAAVSGIAKTGTVTTTDGINVTQYINIDANGSALFNVDTDPASKYLIETRNEYIDVSKLKGSEYLLERINYNPETDLRFLGDAFYEQKLVSAAILKSTSRRFLEESIKSDQDQMAWLLDNAASAYSDLKLAVGVALTKEQINLLQQPIIWYVEDVVMGVKVLVPRVYIPEHILDGFSADSGSMIAGNSVKINATGSVYNSGTINGTSSVNIAAVDNITNSGGTIKSGGDIALSTEKGDIINETKVYTTETVFTETVGGFGSKDGVSREVVTDVYYTSVLGSTGTIQSGGKLTVNSGGNFVNRGADVKADGDASITAAGNIDFETVQARNKGYSAQYDTYGTSDTTTVTGSTLTVGGNLTMNSGRDINFIGSSADIAGNADINTGGNFNLINDYNTSYYEGSKTEDKTFSSSTTTVVATTKTVVGSSFNTGGNLNVDSGNDINIVGSDVNAGGNADLKAEGTQNIIAVHDESTYSRVEETSGFGTGGALYGTEKKTDRVTDRTVNGSSVDIKGMYSSNSGGDTNIIGSSITAGEAVITTGGDLNIKAAYNEHAEEHKTETTGFGTKSGDLASMEIDAKGSGSTTAAASVLNIGNLTVKSGNDVYIEGSVINADNATFDTAGDFIETSAKETSYEYSFHEKMSGGLDFKTLAKLVVCPVTALEYDQGRVSLKLGSAEYNQKTEKTETITQSSSELNIGNSLTIDSGNDIIVAGSNINAGGDVSLTAVNNVSIETTEESTKTSTEEISGKAEVTVGVKNAVTDVAYAAKAVKEAKDALKKAKDDYDKYKDNLEKAKDDLAKGLIDKDDYESMKDDGKYYLANIAMSTENVVAKTAALLQATASAAATAGTYGFSADIQLQIDGSYEKTQSKDITSKGSSINAGGNFTVTAGNKAKIEGSDVSASGDIILDAKSVEILAAENTSTSSTKSGNISTTISVGTASVGGPSINGSASLTESGSSSTTYTNSHLSGSNITIKSTEDTTVRGGVVTADNALKLEVGGDLTVESLQDRSKNHSNTVGVSGGSGGSAGANANISSGNKKWVTEQTSLTGGVVDIYVENKTTLTGAVIASTTGDLTLDTGSLEFSDIKDKDRSNNLGGGVNANGLGSDNLTGSVNATYGFTDKRQTNFATIGEGTITVRDAAAGTTGIEGLNRDVSISQYNTKDGGLQGGFTVDAATVNLVTHPVNTVITTVVAISDGYDAAAKTTGIIVKETAVVVEKGGNALEYGHFTTDDKVQYCLNMDDYENKKANGESVDALDTLVYLKSKSAADYELDRSDLSDLRLSSGIVIDGATDAIKENLEANIRVNSRDDILASLAVLDKYDSGDASDARSYLSGVRAEDNNKIQLDTNSSLRSAELRTSGETQLIYNEQHANDVPRYIYINGGASINLVAGAGGIVLGAEVGVIVDRETGDYKFTAFEVASVDAAGLDISVSGKRGTSYANNYQNIDDAYEGLLGGGYNVSAGIVGYSQNEDGNWKGLSQGYGTKLSIVNVNYAQTTVIKEYETQNIVKDK
jgi:filamentous hemagglutinin family protein